MGSKTEVSALIAVEGGEGRHQASGPSNHEDIMKQELDPDLTGQQELWLGTLGEKVWGTESDLDENAYGAAAVALVRDIPKLVRQYKESIPWGGVSLTLTRLGFSLGIMVMNLLFQSLILWYIYIFVVLPSVRHVQMLYAEFHGQMFDADGNFDHDAWESYEGKQQVCQITMSSRKFYFGILTLWGLLMMQELRSCQRVAMDIMAVRSVDSLDQMLDYVNTGNYELGGRCLIIGLTKGMRAAVLVLVCLPRAIIGLVLLSLGCQWLSSSASFADMTLNAMALEFVKNIDEILYDSILPRQLKNEIAETNVFKIEKQKTKADLDSAEWKGYKRTVGWIGFMVVFLAGYGSIVQNVLPFDLSELKTLCAEQVQESQTPLCNHVTWMGGSESCYPYGLGLIDHEHSHAVGHHTESEGHLTSHIHVAHHAGHAGR
jgi:hypothetical protein